MARNKVDSLDTLQNRLQQNADSSFGNILPAVVTNDDVQRYLETAMNQFKAVNQDFITNRQYLPVDFITNWNNLSTEWQKYYNDKHGTYHFLGCAEIMDQTDLYLKRIKDMQAQASKVASQGYHGVAPDVVIDPNNNVERKKDGMSTGTKVVIGAGLGIFGYLLAKRLL